MDWPEISSTDNMTPVDNNETNGGLITAQTETQLSNNDNDKRLINSNVQPVAPESLPTLSDCSGDIDDKIGCGDMMKLVQTENAISAGSEMVFMEMKSHNDIEFNLLNDETSYPATVESSDASNIDLENNLTQSVEDSEDFKLVEDVDSVPNVDNSAAAVCLFETKSVEDSSLSIEETLVKQSNFQKLKDLELMSEKVPAIDNMTDKLIACEELIGHENIEAANRMSIELNSPTVDYNLQQLCLSESGGERSSEVCLKADEVCSKNEEGRTDFIECIRTIGVAQGKEQESLEEICDINVVEEDKSNDKLNLSQSYFAEETLTPNEKNNNDFVESLLYETESNIVLDKSDKANPLKEDCVELNNDSSASDIVSLLEKEPNMCSKDNSLHLDASETNNRYLSATNDKICLTEEVSSSGKAENENSPSCSKSVLLNSNETDFMNENLDDSIGFTEDNECSSDTSSKSAEAMSRIDTRCDIDQDYEVDPYLKCIENMDDSSSFPNTVLTDTGSESRDIKIGVDSNLEMSIQVSNKGLKYTNSEEYSVPSDSFELGELHNPHLGANLVSGSKDESTVEQSETVVLMPSNKLIGEQYRETLTDADFSFERGLECKEENTHTDLSNPGSYSNFADTTNDIPVLPKSDFENTDSESVSIKMEFEDSNYSDSTVQTGYLSNQSLELEKEDNLGTSNLKDETSQALLCTDDSSVDSNINLNLIVSKQNISPIELSDEKHNYMFFKNKNNDLVESIPNDSLNSVPEVVGLLGKPVISLGETLESTGESCSNLDSVCNEESNSINYINRAEISSNVANNDKHSVDVTNIELDGDEKINLVISLSDDEDCSKVSGDNLSELCNVKNQDNTDLLTEKLINSIDDRKFSEIKEPISEDSAFELSDSCSRNTETGGCSKITEKFVEDALGGPASDTISHMPETDVERKSRDVSLISNSDQKENLLGDNVSVKEKESAGLTHVDQASALNNIVCASKNITQSDSSILDGVSVETQDGNIVSTFPAKRNALPEIKQIHSVAPENSNEISEAVKFFFQQGSNLDKFFGPASFQALQLNPLNSHNRKLGLDSEPNSLIEDKAKGPDSPQQTSCEKTEPVPITFIPEHLIDNTGRKLPPLLPKIPVAFVISDVRNLAGKNLLTTETPVAGNIPVLEMSRSPATIVTSMNTTVATTGATTTGLSSGGVKNNTGPDVHVPSGVILQPQKPRRQQRKPRQRKPKETQITNQLSTPLFNTFTNITASGGRLVTGNLTNHKLADPQIVVSSNNEQKQQKVPKRQPRNKGAQPRVTQCVSTSIDENNKSTCTGSVNGGGMCGRRLQNVVNKLHQAVNSNSSARLSQESILHNLLMSKDKIPDRSGSVTSTIQCLKVMDSTLNLQKNIITTFRIPSALTIIPQTVRDSQPKITETIAPKMPEPQKDVEDSVVNRLKKLGTIIEVERSPQYLATVQPPQTLSSSSSLPPPPPLTPIFLASAQQTGNSASGIKDPDITAQCLKMLESLASTGNGGAQVPKKKPCRKRMPAVSKRNDLSRTVIKSEVLPQNKSDSILSPLVSTNVVVDQASLASSSSSSSSSSSGTSTSSSSSLLDVSVNKSVPSNSVLECEKPTAEVKSSLVSAPEQIEPKYVFQIDSSQVLTLPGAQRLLTCDICDGVYHKTMSLKKHYLKTHLNSKYLSDSDRLVCGLLQLAPDKPPPPKKITKIFIGDLSSWVNTSMPGLFSCFTCGACFDQKADLKTHLVEHPPVSLMKVKEGKLETFMCSGCSKTFAKKKLFMQHRKICDQKNAGLLLNQHCLYCDKSFLSIVARNKHHFKMHHPKRKFQPCFVCKSKKIRDISTLYKHMCLQHKDKYFGCINCKLRYLTRTELLAHNKETHETDSVEGKREPVNPSESSGKKTSEVLIVDRRRKTVVDANSKHKCDVCGKAFSSELNVSRHHRLAHGVHPRKKIQSVTPTKKTTTIDNKDGKEASQGVESKIRDENSLTTPSSAAPVIDPETQFYSRITINIRENLLHHLDGKLDSQEMLECDLHAPSEQGSKNKLMNFSASFTSSRGSLDSSDQSNFDSKQNSNPVSPKVPWEKFNFPKNYDGRCGLTSYIKDMSHLDISTQLTMRRNLQRLNSSAEIDPPPDVIANVPAGLSLMGLLSAESFGETNCNNEGASESKAGMELSGEWTRPRNYVCAVCSLCTNNFWELEDHKMALHPNVWCPHHEVLAEHTSCWEFVYTRKEFTSTGVLGSYGRTELATNSGNRCTKCNKYYPSSSDLHRHMLDCGGDTTWMSTMLAVASPGSRRNRKWRPFGSRRRRQQGRRGLKRNIPNTPAKQPGMRIRTKPGDTETIQKMIANLPPKRITRRIIGDDVEIKTRSQGTLSSASTAVGVMQKQRASLAKFVKKPDNSKPPVKNTASGKGSKDAKSPVDEKLEKPVKKTEKAVRKSISSPSKKKQEILKETETKVKEEMHVKDEKLEPGVEKMLNSSTQQSEVDNANKEEGKLINVKEEVENCKEINIVVVSTRKSEAVKPNQSATTESTNLRKQVLEKSSDEVHDESKNDNGNTKKTTVTPQLKEDKGINTDFEDIEFPIIAPTKSVPIIAPETTAPEIEVDSKPDVSPKRAGKCRKDENKKLLETEKKKKDSDEFKNKICKEGKLIMCNGCGMQFDSTAACQRHMKTCVYWKQEKTSNLSANTKVHACGICSKSFPYLMALLRHKCASPDDDRAMPELIREEPFQEAEAVPVEGAKDIPILSPEDIQKNNQTAEISKPLSASQKNNKNTIRKRFSTVESIVDSISEVSKETYSLESYLMRICPNDKFKEASSKEISLPIAVTYPNNCKASHTNTVAVSSVELSDHISDGATVTPNITDLPESNFISSENSSKPIQDVMEITTIKNVPKQVELDAHIGHRQTVKETESKKFKKSPNVLQTAGIKRKLTSLNRNRNKGIKKRLLSKAKKKRSTALEILLRENKLMSESRKPVKTVEKRKSASPVCGISKHIRKRRKLNDNSTSKNDTESAEENDVTDVEIHSENQEVTNLIPVENVKLENENLMTSSEEVLTIIKREDPNDGLISIEGADNFISPNFDFALYLQSKIKVVESYVKQPSEHDSVLEMKNKSNSEDNKILNCNEQLAQPSKSQNRSPKKLKSVTDESLIITGSRRKTNAINRWDMYRPSCSNGRVYCEPCNKEVKEDGMAKHEQSLLHIRNIDLKTDFDSLFPDAYEFITNCSRCSWNFPTPFTCYKHYLQKHEDSLPELIEQLLGKKDEKTVLEKTNNGCTDIKGKESPKNMETESYEKFDVSDVVEPVKPTSHTYENDNNIASEEKHALSQENENVEIKLENESSVGQETIAEDYTKTLKDVTPTDNLKMEEDSVSDHIQQSKSETVNKLIYCEICNKGVHSNAMARHEQGVFHKRNVNLKNEFDLKYPKEKYPFPLFCDRCNLYFINSFLCYNHYQLKHANEFNQFVDEIESKHILADVKQETSNVVTESLESIEQSPENEFVSVNVKLEADVEVTPSHLYCQICNKRVKFELIHKHVNTSLHKQYIGSWTETEVTPNECKLCCVVKGISFLCQDHNTVKPESISVSTKKKRLKKKNISKRDPSDSDSDNEKLINLVKQGRIAKRKKKLKFKKNRNKLQNVLKGNSPSKLADKNTGKAIEIRTDVSTKVTCDRLLQKRRKRFAFGQIRNRWEVSVVDPGLASLSDSSSYDAKTEVTNPITAATTINRISAPMTPEIESPDEDISDSNECLSPSSGGSEFFCMLCKKQFSSAVSLVRHQSSPSHKFNERKNIPSTALALKHPKRNESSVGRCDPASSNTNKSKELVPSTLLAQSITVPQFQGSESSETNPDWTAIDVHTNPENRLQPGNIPQQEWSHDWIMNSSNSSISQWDVNNSGITSQLWDNSDNNLMSAVGCSSSLGSILDSVNKILADDGNASLLPQYSLAELQTAMGASDEEMAMLQQLGERSFQDEFLYEGSNSVCSFGEQWSISGSASCSTSDDNTTTLMDLDNQQPPSLQMPGLQETAQPTNATSSLANSASAASTDSSAGPSYNMKNEPLENCEGLDKSNFRGLKGRSKKLLDNYESREMVCPSCCKHFLGLSALQQHVTWSQCSSHTSSNNTRSRMWLRKRALLNRTEDVDRKLVCYVCKEIFNSATSLDTHLSTQHASSTIMKKETGDQSTQNTDSTDGAERLKSKMSNALGGLLDRALNNLFCSKTNSLGQSGQDSGTELSSGTIQILSKLCAVRNKTAAVNTLKELQTRQDKSSAKLASELCQLISRGKCKTDSVTPLTPALSSTFDRLTMVLANGQEQQSYPCPVCDDRFLKSSSLTRHIAQTHKKYRLYCIRDQERNRQETCTEVNADNEFEHDWRDVSDLAYDSDGESGTQNTEVKPLCSDCGLGFASIQEMISHRKELHPTQTIKNQVDLPVSENIVDSTSGEGKLRGRRSAKPSTNQSSIGQVGSSKQNVRSRRKQKSGGVRNSKPVLLKVDGFTINTDKAVAEEETPKLEEGELKVTKKSDHAEGSTGKNLRNISKTVHDRKSTRRVGEGEKPQLPNLVKEDVRVKAEAALRELSSLKSNKTLSPLRWGVERLRFTKQNSSSTFKSASEALSRVNYARAKFTMLMAENKCGSSSGNAVVNTVKSELSQSGSESANSSDVYDFNEFEELGASTNKVTLPYGQLKDDKDKSEDSNEKWVFIKEDLELPLDS